MRIRPLLRTAAVFTILAAALSAAAVQAQVATGSVSGSVSDPSGRPVPGATVVASDGARASARRAVSDETGRYRFADLPPALYDVSAAAQGFERVEIVVAEEGQDGGLAGAAHHAKVVLQHREELALAGEPAVPGQ